MSRECKAGTPAQNFTNLSRNHQEALYRKRFLERKRDAPKNDTSATVDLPVYEPKERMEIADPPKIYGWKHGEQIRHRKLDNQPRDQVTRLIKLTEAQLESSSCNTPADHGARKKHFKV